VTDGTDTVLIEKAIKKAKGKKDQPTLIEIKTVIGFGSPKHAGNASAHGAPLGDEERTAVAAAYNYQEAPFVIKSDVYNFFTETVANRGHSAYKK